MWPWRSGSSFDNASGLLDLPTLGRPGWSEDTFRIFLATLEILEDRKRFIRPVHDAMNQAREFISRSTLANVSDFRRSRSCLFRSERRPERLCQSAKTPAFGTGLRHPRMLEAPNHAFE